MLGDRGKSAGEEEDLQEKKAELEMQYKKLQLALHDVLDSNEELSAQNRGKDLVLTVKEKELVELTARNALEVEQLQLEQTCLIEDLNHQLEAVSGHVLRRELQKERYLILRQENEDINGAIQKLREEMSQQNEVHAKEIHRLNVFMKNERIRMEELFRSELVAMDMAFQNKAFLELDDGRKQAMFANTKLKDELGLLSVGLSALGVRYEKDTRSARDTLQNLDDLERGGRALQTAVKSLMTLKVGKRETISQIKADIRSFRQKKAEVDAALSRGPSVAELEKTLFQTEVLLGREERAIAMWKERKRLLNLLNKEFKTATFGGTNHLFDSASLTSGMHSRNNSLVASDSPHSKTWAPGGSVESPGALGSLTHSGTGASSSLGKSKASRTNDDTIVSIATMNSSKRGADPRRQPGFNRTTSGINLQSLSASDKELRKGLRKLVGRESMLIDAYNENPETNVTAWTTAQIVDIFNTTFEQWKVTNDAVESQLAAIAAQAATEERRIRQAEDQEAMEAALSDESSQGSQSLSKQLSQESMEKVRSARSMGAVFQMASSSSSDHSSETEEENEEDVEELFVGESMDEILSDLDRPMQSEESPRAAPTMAARTESVMEEEREAGDEPAPLLIDLCASRSALPSPVPLSAVRFKSHPDMMSMDSPGVDTSAPTVRAGAPDYFSQSYDSPTNESFNDDPSDVYKDSEYDKNGLHKSYSANAVIRQAQLDKVHDAERRSSYIGFRNDTNLEQLLLASQNNIKEHTASKSSLRVKADFQPIKLGKKVNYLDGIEPPLATRQHLKVNVDITPLLDPRVKPKGSVSILHGSKTDTNLLAQDKNRHLVSFTAKGMSSSHQKLNYSKSGIGREDSNQYVSSESIGQKKILNMVSSLKHTAEDPLSGKSTRALQKKY